MNILTCFLVLAVCLAATSCSKEVQCITYPLNGFAILSDGGHLTDSAANAAPFVHGSNFTKPLAVSYTGRALTGNTKKKTFTVDTLLMGLDWRITLLPSGRQYHIEDIRINEHRSKEVKKRSSDAKCYNSFFYTLDTGSTAGTDSVTDGYLDVGY